MARCICMWSIRAIVLGVWCASVFLLVAVRNSLTQ